MEADVKKVRLRLLLLDYIPMILVGTFIIVAAVIEEQSFFKTLPTLITLLVQLLLIRVNRFAFLLGGINSALYGFTFISEGLYFSAASALGVNVPIQLFSFFNWSNHTDGKSNVELKRLSVKKTLVSIIFSLVGFFIGYYLFIPFFEDSTSPVLDLISFVLAFVVLIFGAFRYIESQYISIVSSLISLVIWVAICIENPANLNYVIINLYNLYRAGEAAVIWTKKYMHI